MWTFLGQNFRERFQNQASGENIVYLSSIIQSIFEDKNLESDSYKAPIFSNFQSDEQPFFGIISAMVFMYITMALHFIIFYGSAIWVFIILLVCMFVCLSVFLPPLMKLELQAPKILTFLIFYVMNSFIAMIFYLSMNDKEEKSESIFLKYSEKQRRYGNAESIVGASIALLIFGWVMLKFSNLWGNNSNKKPSDK